MRKDNHFWSNTNGIASICTILTSVGSFAYTLYTAPAKQQVTMWEMFLRNSEMLCLIFLVITVISLRIDFYRYVRRQAEKEAEDKTAREAKEAADKTAREAKETALKEYILQLSAIIKVQKVRLDSHIGQKNAPLLDTHLEDGLVSKRDLRIYHNGIPDFPEEA